MVNRFVASSEGGLSNLGLLERLSDELAVEPREERDEISVFDLL
jgi:hypothetical protein